MRVATFSHGIQDASARPNRTNGSCIAVWWEGEKRIKARRFESTQHAVHFILAMRAAVKVRVEKGRFRWALFGGGEMSVQIYDQRKALTTDELVPLIRVAQAKKKKAAQQTAERLARLDAELGALK